MHFRTTHVMLQSKKKKKKEKEKEENALVFP